MKPPEPSPGNPAPVPIPTAAAAAAASGGGYAVDWAVRASAADELVHELERRATRRRRRRVGAATVALGLALCALIGLRWGSRNGEREAARTRPFALAATGADAAAWQALSDGSIVELKGDA